MSSGKSGSLVGGTLLITGSCIGAGMLGLPILTGMAGFVPGFVMFIIAWLFMTTTALYLVEVNAWFEGPVNLLSMVKRTLGKFGLYSSWILYLFLFYALLVAYLSGSGNLVASFAKHTLGIAIPDWFGSLFFSVVFGWIVYLGTRPVDLMNRWLMAAKIVAYLILIVIGVGAINTGHFFFHRVEYAFFALPVLIISFGFHNMIPSLSAYLGGDLSRTKKAILCGSLLTFAIYIFWEIVAIGILPPELIYKSYHQDIDAAQAIRTLLGKNAIGLFAQLLAFFAILTSFLAQSLSLVHFIADGFKTKKREGFWLCCAALLPPIVFSLIFPQLFFKALNFAGGVCAVVLFGVFPALMVWIGRYRHKIPANYRLSGGQPLLIIILIFALCVLSYQVSVMCGHSFLPTPGQS